MPMLEEGPKIQYKIRYMEKSQILPNQGFQFKEVILGDVSLESACKQFRDWKIWQAGNPDICNARLIKEVAFER